MGIAQRVRALSMRPSSIAACVTAAFVIFGVAHVHAQTSDVIQSQETNIGGVVGEITQVKRKDGVLTIRLRLRNTGPAETHVDVIKGRNFDSYYVVAGSKKYFLLKDSEDTPLSPPVDGVGGISTKLAKDGTYTWWAKYPAPPADVKEVSYYTPYSPPFEDLPITD